MLADKKFLSAGKAERMFEFRPCREHAAGGRSGECGESQRQWYKSACPAYHKRWLSGTQERRGRTRDELTGRGSGIAGVNIFTVFSGGKDNGIVYPDKNVPVMEQKKISDISQTFTCFPVAQTNRISSGISGCHDKYRECFFRLSSCPFRMKKEVMKGRGRQHDADTG